MQCEAVQENAKWGKYALMDDGWNMTGAGSADQNESSRHSTTQWQCEVVQQNCEIGQICNDKNTDGI
jgi:hypothetical protein